MPDNNDDKPKSGSSKPAKSGVTPQQQRDWNDYVNWLGQKGIKAHPDLNKGEGDDNNGIKVLKKYIELHPNTSLTPDIVPHIQQSFIDMRNHLLDEVKKGNMKLDKGVTPDNFLKDLSGVDGVPGQNTTRYQFPEVYTKYLDSQNKVVKTTDDGLTKATASN